MPGVRVTTRRFVDAQTVMDVVPVLGCCVGGINTQLLDVVDGLQDTFDFRSSRQRQENGAAGLDLRDGGAALTCADSAKNIGAR